MPKLSLDGSKIKVVLQKDDELFLTPETIEFSAKDKTKGIKVGLADEKLSLSCDFRVVSQISGELLEKVLAKEICRPIRNAPIEYLILEGGTATLLDVVQLWGGEVEYLSHAAKYTLWHKLFCDPQINSKLNVSDVSKTAEENYKKARDICKKVVSQIL